MRVLVDGIEVLSEKFDTWDQIIDAYAESEATEGRKVPDYAWETLALAIGGWVLKKVGDGLIAWYSGRKKRQEEERRKRELDEKLSNIFQQQKQILEKLKQLDGVLSFAREANVSIEIQLETEAECDLEEGLRQLTKGIPSVLIHYPRRGSHRATSPPVASKRHKK